MNLVCPLTTSLAPPLQLHITYGLHLHQFTALHTFPSTITPITQLSPITHLPWLSCHTCSSFTHTHISSTLPYTRAKSCSCPGWHSWAFTIPSDCYFCVWPRDSLTLELLNLCLWPRPRLVLFTSLLCLWYSCYFPLTIACLTLPLSK